jgi:hypothetical protein
MPSGSFLGGKVQTRKGSSGSELISAEDVDKNYMSKASPKIVEGANAAMGTTVLVGGAKVVANTKVTANTRIFLTSQADGGTPGWLRISARTPGTSFTITSSSGADTSTVAYELIEPDA